MVAGLSVLVLEPGGVGRQTCIPLPAAGEVVQSGQWNWTKLGTLEGGKHAK